MSKINKIKVENTTYDVEDSEVKAWARANEKPSYNYSEINNTPDLSNFITKDVNNLTNYELKTNTGATIELTINSSTYEMTLNLKNSSGTTISTGNVDLPLETMVVGATYDNNNKKIILELKNGTTLDVPVGDLINGLQSEITSSNKLDASLVDDSLSTNKFTNSTEKTAWNSKYDKPSTGIPKTDLAQAVQDSLDLADSAVQSNDLASVATSGSYNDLTNKPTIPDVSGKEDTSNKVSTIDSTSTNTQYAGAKAVWDLVSSLSGGATVGYVDTTSNNGFNIFTEKLGVYLVTAFSANSDFYYYNTSTTKAKVTGFSPFIIFHVKNVNEAEAWEPILYVFGYNGSNTNTGRIVMQRIYKNTSGNVTYDVNDKSTYMKPEFMLNGIEQTFYGVKTFYSLPQSSATPTNNNDLVNKSYVDSAIASAITTTLNGSY